jgi:hypothetical protein
VQREVGDVHGRSPARGYLSAGDSTSWVVGGRPGARVAA